jgi:hypothetical protein
MPFDKSRFSLKLPTSISNTVAILGSDTPFLVVLWNRKPPRACCGQFQFPTIFIAVGVCPTKGTDCSEILTFRKESSGDVFEPMTE